MFASIVEAGRALRSRKVSCLELVEESLRAIEAQAHLNAFITVTAEQARAEAATLDDQLRSGQDLGPLHGIPIALKDLFFTKGVRTTNGSKVFSDFVPDFDATVVSHLRTAGAISMGKLNMHEIAYGITSNNPHFGPVRNPHALDRIPGGSSGGSGAAVASGMVLAAMGSDTGGSIRIPASYCGTVGFKPTFGLVSRYGVFPLGLTLDHMGPLTRTVADAELVFRAIAGADPMDPATVDSTFPRTAEAADLRGVKVGLAKNFFNEAADPEVSQSCSNAAKQAQRAGAEIVEVDVPDPAGLNIIARTVLLCEAASVMSPHHHRRQDLGADVLTLLDMGSLLRATEYVEAQRIRAYFQKAWAQMLLRVDVMLTPSTPIAAPLIGVDTLSINGAEEDVRLASTRLVRGVNALGVPAISLPSGVSRSGLPLSIQLIGRAYEDARLLAIARGFEAELGVAPLAKM